MICMSVKRNCWNMFESFGEICVGCGCCSRDPIQRAKSRRNVLKRQIDHFESFDEWFDDEEFRAVQEDNLKSTLKMLKRQLRYYERKLREN